MSVKKEVTTSRASGACEHSHDTVLLADDGTGTARILAEEIRREYPRCAAMEVSDAVAAGDLIAATRPAAVILDLHLAGLDRAEVRQQIRAQAEAAGTTVIALVGALTAETQQMMNQCGAAVCLAKPLDMEDFLRHLASALSPGGRRPKVRAGYTT